jgi:hypothetical protein
MKLRTENLGDVVLALDYWDCECDENYIHHVCETECARCGVIQGAENAPSSRQDEVEGLFDSASQFVVIRYCCEGIAGGCVNHGCHGNPIRTLQVGPTDREMAERHVKGWNAYDPILLPDSICPALGEAPRCNVLHGRRKKTV